MTAAGHGGTYLAQAREPFAEIGCTVPEPAI
jgi:hypothetical protein